MQDVFVARIMSTDLHTVSPDTLVEDAAGEILANGIGSLVVVDGDGHLAGILTTTDFVRVVAESRPKAETAVSAYMTTEVTTATAQDPIREVADAMLEGGFHHVPVVDDREGVIGMVTTTDLAAYLSHVRKPTVV